MSCRLQNKNNTRHVLHCEYSDREERKTARRATKKESARGRTREKARARVQCKNVRSNQLTLGGLTYYCQFVRRGKKKTAVYPCDLQFVSAFASKTLWCRRISQLWHLWKIPSIDTEGPQTVSQAEKKINQTHTQLCDKYWLLSVACAKQDRRKRAA